MSTLRAGSWAAVCLGLALAKAFGQSDPLVSKNLPLLLSDGRYFWAFAQDGLRYSRLDLSGSAPDIRNGTLPFKGGARGGLGRDSSLLLYYNYAGSDSVTTAGLVTLDRQNRTMADSLLFARGQGKTTQISGGAEASALALGRDTVALGAGRLGFALVPAKAEGQGVLPAAPVEFWTLPRGRDTAVNVVRCQTGKVCKVDTLNAVKESLGEPDSVSCLAIDSSASDSAWLLIGTSSGLRRGRLGSRVFPRVSLPGIPDTSATRIESIHADSRAGILWVFAGSSYYFSGDHGRSFHVPPDAPGVGIKPSQLKGFSSPPQVAVLGDTSHINFSMEGSPGLVLFRKDTVLANAGGGLSEVLLDSEDGLDISLKQGQLTGLAVARSGSTTILAAGTDSKGLLYRKTGPGQTGAWANVNSLRQVQNGLEEVITFPTLFTGAEGEVVRIGYRLKKDGRVTITVYNYAMEKVKTLVKSSPRKGGISRSENSSEDAWDGKDASGRFVSVGTYYILVETDKGEKGWGKAIAVRGRR